MNGNGHGPGGQFAVGNPGGPGRPRRRCERDYLRTLTKAVTRADWCEVCLKALAQAKAGDKAARDWLSRHLLAGPDAGDLLARIEQLETRLRRG